MQGTKEADPDPAAIERLENDADARPHHGQSHQPRRPRRVQPRLPGQHHGQGHDGAQEGYLLQGHHENEAGRRALIDPVVDTVGPNRLVNRHLSAPRPGGTGPCGDR